MVTENDNPFGAPADDEDEKFSSANRSAFLRDNIEGLEIEDVRAIAEAFWTLTRAR